ncbi:helix-turn-helix domain-containing protein [Novosphingobium sp. ES2-1]|nr:helix-turn-helix domain-containing protein [Novosphingobium sp. ES2-1]
MLGIKRTLLFRYLAEGSLRRCKIGRKTVVPMDSIKNFAAARTA